MVFKLPEWSWKSAYIFWDSNHKYKKWCIEWIRKWTHFEWIKCKNSKTSRNEFWVPLYFLAKKSLRFYFLSFARIFEVFSQKVSLIADTVSASSENWHATDSYHSPCVEKHRKNRICVIGPKSDVKILADFYTFQVHDSKWLAFNRFVCFLALSFLWRGKGVCERNAVNMRTIGCFKSTQRQMGGARNVFFFLKRGHPCVCNLLIQFLH